MRDDAATGGVVGEGIDHDADRRAGHDPGRGPARAGRISHWINGLVVAGTSGREGQVYNPATGAVAKHVDFASVEEVGAAVAAARTAFPAWRATSLSKRTEIMFRVRKLWSSSTARRSPRC